MSYRVPENDLAGYYRNGFVVFRQIVPTTLVGDLRRAAEKGRSAQYEAGEQNDVQRIQPVSKYESVMDQRPFKDYAELPALRDAVAQVLSPEHDYGRLDIMGVLLHPEHQPYCTHWHRDITLETSRLSPEQFHDLMLDWSAANQINCPLYHDTCTWYVPGSHLRWRDMPGELAWSARWSKAAMGRTARAQDVVAKERACWNYTSGMPGAVQLHLSPGDFCLYRPLGWHIGNYVPYARRATLHDVAFTPRYEAWWRAWRAGESPQWQRAAEATAAVPG